MTDRWERLTDLYIAAADLSADERAALLAEECGDDPALQADVERMVAAHNRARPEGDMPTGAPATTSADDNAAATRRFMMANRCSGDRATSISGLRCRWPRGSSRWHRTS